MDLKFQKFQTTTKCSLILNFIFYPGFSELPKLTVTFNTLRILTRFYFFVFIETTSSVSFHDILPCFYSNYFNYSTFIEN